jgi:hypothetical protein
VLVSEVSSLLFGSTGLIIGDGCFPDVLFLWDFNKTTSRLFTTTIFTSIGFPDDGGTRMVVRLWPALVCSRRVQ